MDDSQQFVGAMFDGRYKIERVVGIGGMAFVYEAIDEQTGGKVAIKLLKEKFSDDNRAVRRFINESKSLELLNHPNIVKIYDISVETKHKYIVMEYINGVTLRKFMNYKRPLDWREAIEFTEQIALALDNAHTNGIIHRDIKPQNIMIMQGGKVKVTDFGIAKMPNSESLTMVDKAIGTVYYISPEQASSRKIDARSDIYSLGVMLYEMVTGQMPFTADTPIAVIMKHMNTPPTPPSKLVPSLPAGLEQIILCAMDKNPKNRYQSAAQMLRHLRRLKMDENTVFNIPKPAPRTPTSENTIRKTIIHSSDEKQKSPYDVEERPPSPHQPKQHVKTPKHNAAPSAPLDAKTSKLTEPHMPTEKRKIVSEPPPRPRSSSSSHASAHTSPNASTHTSHAAPRPNPQRPAPSAPKKKAKQKKNPLSLTATLVIIIICLIIAIAVTLSLMGSMGNSEESLAAAAQAQTQTLTLYLKQVFL